MKRLAILLALVLIPYVGYTKFYRAGYTKVSSHADDLGITAATPLGTAQGLDRHLLNLGLEKRPTIKRALSEIGLEAVPSNGYVERGAPSPLAGGESITLFVDDQGTLLAVMGMYKLPTDTQGAHTTPISNFLVSYWKQVGFGEPTFSERITRVSSEFPDGKQQLAIITKNPVRGRWLKGFSRGHLLVHLSSQRPAYQDNVRSFTDWQRDLKSPAKEERLRAASAIAQFGSEAVPSLVDALHDTDYMVREVAVNSLIRVGPAAVPRLKPVLDDVDNDTALRAAGALVKMGPASVPVLVELIKADYSDSWQRMLTGLHSMTPEGRAAAVPELVKLLQDPDNEVRERAGMAMRQMGPEALAAAPFLVQTLGGDRRMHGMARGVLVQLGERAIPSLMVGLKDSKPEVREETIKTFAIIDKRLINGAVPELASLCERDPDPKVRAQAWATLKNISGKSLQPGQCQ